MIAFHLPKKLQKQSFKLSVLSTLRISSVSVEAYDPYKSLHSNVTFKLSGILHLNIYPRSVLLVCSRSVSKYNSDLIKSCQVYRFDIYATCFRSMIKFEQFTYFDTYCILTKQNAHFLWNLILSQMIDASFSQGRSGLPCDFDADLW